MPLKESHKQEGVKEASDTIHNNSSKMVLDEVSNECDKVEDFELKDSNEVGVGYKYFVGSDNFVEKVDKNMEIDSLNHTSFVLDGTIKESADVGNGLADVVAVESVKKLVERNNGLSDDQLLFVSDSNQDRFSEDTNLGKMVTEYIETVDVLHLEILESTKDGLEKLTGNGDDNMEWHVGVGDFQKYEVGLMGVEDALLLRLHECLICLDISSFGHENEHKAQTVGKYILTNIQVFDPGGRLVCDSRGSSSENVVNKLELETDCSVVVVILYVKSLLGMKGNEFQIISPLDNVVRVCVFENMLVLEGADIGNSVTTPLAQTLCEKEYQWLCDLNKFSTDSISWLCEFGVKCVGVQPDVNHDDGLVVCNKLVQKCGRHEKAEPGTYKWCRSFEEQRFCLGDDSWSMKRGVGCIITECVQGISQFNLPGLVQSEQVPGDISKHGKGGIEPDVIDTCMGFVDACFRADFYDPPQPLCVKDSQA
ncbi:zinc finger CCCH domain-containing protein 27 [Artemisia annua]|uniref:Zinc finger CCCH domain-containing protein 27 n=1 Tax=Artemisia annua TaxID=35608 RepID=A0A2U1PQT3_ARTAN|nr:zinc finger CCCH domain-containing protein 27 [Artemisia annua]